MSVDKNALREQLNVSRETFERLEILSELLKKWNPKINLVSRATIDDLWARHIVDSVQVFRCAAEINGGHWLDIGSGGGFPGLVIAIMNVERDRPFRVSMMESDVRKCSFLRTVLRETGVKAEVIAKRIEKADPARADIISARALAELSLLLEFSQRHLKAGGIGIFPKGVQWKKELNAAQESWSFQAEVITSKTQEGAVILKVGDLKRV